MSQNTGFNEHGANEAIENIIGGGADVRLLGTAADHPDGASNLDTKEIDGSGYSAVSVARADWTLTVDSTAHTVTLTNDNELSFGTAGEAWGTVESVVIHAPATSQFIITDDSSTPDIPQGEEVTIPAGSITYTLGGA